MNHIWHNLELDCMELMPLNMFSKHVMALMLPDRLLINGTQVTESVQRLFPCDTGILQSSQNK